MAIVKSHTDLSQSKILSRILSDESADMWYQHTGISIKDGSEKPIYFPMVIRDCETDYDIPCWSLAALLSVIPEPKLIKTSIERWELRCWSENRYFWTSDVHADPIGACVEMIIKLHELKKL